MRIHSRRVLLLAFALCVFSFSGDSANAATQEAAPAHPGVCTNASGQPSRANVPDSKFKLYSELKERCEANRKAGHDKFYTASSDSTQRGLDATISACGGAYRKMAKISREYLENKSRIMLEIREICRGLPSCNLGGTDTKKGFDGSKCLRELAAQVNKIADKEAEIAKLLEKATTEMEPFQAATQEAINRYDADRTALELAQQKAEAKAASDDTINDNLRSAQREQLLLRDRAVDVAAATPAAANQDNDVKLSKVVNSVDVQPVVSSSAADVENAPTVVDAKAGGASSISEYSGVIGKLMDEQNIVGTKVSEFRDDTIDAAQAYSNSAALYRKQAAELETRAASLGSGSGASKSAQLSQSKGSGGQPIEQTLTRKEPSANTDGIGGDPVEAVAPSSKNGMLSSGMNLAGAGLTGAAGLAAGLNAQGTNSSEAVSGASLAALGQTSEGGGSAKKINEGVPGPSAQGNNSIPNSALAKGSEGATNYEYFQQVGISAGANAKIKNRRNYSGASQMNSASVEGVSVSSGGKGGPQSYSAKESLQKPSSTLAESNGVPVSVAGGLSTSNFSLAGADTDESVKDLMGQMKSVTNSEGLSLAERQALAGIDSSNLGRSISSQAENAIEGENGTPLFERHRSLLIRYQKGGKIQASKRPL